MSGRIIGIGGIFIKSKNKKLLSSWYEDVFDIKMEDWGTQLGFSPMEVRESQIFSISSEDTMYYHRNQSYMINWLVDDLNLLVEKLRRKDISVTMGEDGEYGKFAWIDDCDGNKLELWESPKDYMNK